MEASSPEKMADAFGAWYAREQFDLPKDYVAFMAIAFGAGVEYGVRNSS